jgi:AraC family transcriptional regulator, L-rhamnose operon regulatory protein RhaS
MQIMQYIQENIYEPEQLRVDHISHMRIGEIVHELSFTDESHLNRLFKKYKGLSPSAYRRQVAAKPGSSVAL